MKTHFPYKKVYSSEHKHSGRYTGHSIGPYVERISQLVLETKAKTLLDYGCGKGYQYLASRVHEQWGGILPWCYDIGVSQLQRLPEHLVDGVICTDVMEHIDRRDVDTVLDHIFSLVESKGAFVFFAVACRPAKKKFKHYGNRVNVHLTIEPSEWWVNKLENASARSGKSVLLAYEFDEPLEDKDAG